MAEFRRNAELLVSWGHGLHTEHNAAVEAAERSSRLAKEALAGVAAE